MLRPLAPDTLLRAQATPVPDQGDAAEESAWQRPRRRKPPLRRLALSRKTFAEAGSL
jgi:hypothetical protein